MFIFSKTIVAIGASVDRCKINAILVDQFYHGNSKTREASVRCTLFYSHDIPLFSVKVTDNTLLKSLYENSARHVELPKPMKSFKVFEGFIPRSSVIYPGVSN